MKKIKLIKEKFPMVDFLDLKKSDKKTVAIVNKLMEKVKTEGSKVKLPLASSIDVDTSKNVSVDVPSLVRVQYAIFKELSIVFTYEEEKDINGESFRVYFACKLPSFRFPKEVLSEPKKSEGKRESSKVAKERAEEKKRAEEAEAEAINEEQSRLDNEFDKKTVELLEGLCITYGLKLPIEKRNKFEEDVLKILRRVN